MSSLSGYICDGCLGLFIFMISTRQLPIAGIGVGSRHLCIRDSSSSLAWHAPRILGRILHRQLTLLCNLEFCTGSWHFCVVSGLHRQLALLCYLVFSLFLDISVLSCRRLFLLCSHKKNTKGKPSHPSAACRGWEEKRGGQVDGSLVETCTPCHSQVRSSCYSATNGELVGFVQCHRR